MELNENEANDDGQFENFTTFWIINKFTENWVIKRLMITWKCLKFWIDWICWSHLCWNFVLKFCFEFIEILIVDLTKEIVIDNVIMIFLLCYWDNIVLRRLLKFWKKLIFENHDIVLWYIGIRNWNWLYCFMIYYWNEKLIIYWYCFCDILKLYWWPRLNILWNPLMIIFVKHLPLREPQGQTYLCD